MAASYGTVEVIASDKKRLTDKQEDIIVIGELHHRKVTYLHLLLLLMTLLVPPLILWIITSWYLIERKWELYLTAEGIYYTNAPLGCTKSWFIPVQSVKSIVADGSTLHVYTHTEIIKKRGICDCFTRRNYIMIWYLQNAQRFVAAVKKQNKNITRNYHMETVCNF